MSGPGFEDRLREVARAYRLWTLDPEGVSADWRRFFGDLDPPARAWIASFNRPAAGGAPGPERGRLRDSVRAMLLVRNHRVRGHLRARLDPLGLAGGGDHPDLDPQAYGFEEEDMSRPIELDGALGLDRAPLSELVAALRRVYCGSLGAEFMHIQDPVQKHWLQTRLEEGLGSPAPRPARERRAALEGIVRAEEFERFLARRFSGTKRFGLDGAETAVPALEETLRRASELGVDQVLLGMPHRGRLNVLANLMDKPRAAIFREFSGGSSSPEDAGGSGDVKYHLGASADRVFEGRRVHLSLAANPSHLEAVNPVVLGKARAKQRQLGDSERRRVMPLLLHGDAAFAGQGPVAESLDLSDLEGYRVGGAVHLVVNNQIGFTTNPVDARSGPYCSELAKAVEAPILHVNGDDPDAVLRACRLAVEFRAEFGRDVVVDMFCYRRLGHNEMDEPSFTQPRMYAAIAEHPPVSEVHAARLERDGALEPGELEAMRAREREALARDHEAAASWSANRADWLEGVWSRVRPARGWGKHRGETAVPEAELRRLGGVLSRVPEGIRAHPKVLRVLEARGEAVRAGEGLDWATAEALAMASLAAEGHPIRMSGQDCNRGTFAQRHAAVVDQDDERVFKPIAACAANPEAVEIIDSPLSEMAVLGYEYGYSLADPDALVVWEAQFGDFANGAQVIVDQFIASSEAKWLRLSGLVMLLPHGFEGQGPEHSSARPERFLQLAAEDNLQIVNCTTPANYFHALRRQLKRDLRKPLVVLTPKSLLRDRRCVSRLADLAPGSSFHRAAWDLEEDASEARSVVFCSGRVYYDLAEARAAMEPARARETTIVRLEQLYPWPSDAVAEALARAPRGAEIVWCQEEPRNMGAWGFVLEFLEETAEEAGAAEPRPRYAGRAAAAAVATGLLSRHREEQARLVEEALTPGLPRVGRVSRRRALEAEAAAGGGAAPAGVGAGGR